MRRYSPLYFTRPALILISKPGKDFIRQNSNKPICLINSLYSYYAQFIDKETMA